MYKRQVGFFGQFVEFELQHFVFADGADVIDVYKRQSLPSDIRAGCTRERLQPAQHRHLL